MDYLSTYCYLFVPFIISFFQKKGNFRVKISAFRWLNLSYSVASGRLWFVEIEGEKENALLQEVLGLHFEVSLRITKQ